MRTSKILGLPLSAVLIVAMLLSATLPAAAAPTAPTSAGQLRATPSQVTGFLQGTAKAERWPYIIRLEGEPLALYEGGISGLGATNPEALGEADLDMTSAASRAYVAYLQDQQAQFITELQRVASSAQVVHTYQVVLNAVAAIMTAEQAAEVAKLSGVISITPDELLQPTTDVTPGFIGATSVWNGTAAGVPTGNKGDGVIVGVIDTGIWPEHHSFADDGTYPAPPASWQGTCQQPDDGTPGYTCTNKLIGIQHFLDTYVAQGGGYDGLFLSGRDDDGHGTHTASTAAGNQNVPVTLLGIDRPAISGIAPRAYVAAYKGLGPGGGYTSDLVAAIEAATADGVDAINYSIGGGASNPWGDLDSLAFLAARAAGVFVATSAGNSGPGANTVGSPGNAPWVTTVAASTSNRYFVSDVTVNGPGTPPSGIWGVTVTDGVSGLTLVDAQGIPDSLGDASGLCLNPYTPGTFSASQVVLCMRGTNARVAKGDNVADGGAGGVIVYNAAQAQDLNTDNYVIPAVHMTFNFGTALKQYLAAHPGQVTVSFTEGQEVFGPADPRVAPDLMAAFSSRGPNTPAPAIIKPDVTGPGVQILAGASPEHDGDGAQGQLFQSIQGTSMSSPHVAGAGALLTAVHPDWSPAEIQSALMTTGITEVVKENGTTPADPFDMGGGRVDLSRAADPGLVFDMTADDYLAGQTDQANMNLPSLGFGAIAGRATITRTATSLQPAETTWSVSTEAPVGVSITVSPNPVVVPANGTATFQVTVDAVGAPEGWHFGSVTLSNGTQAVGMPVAFQQTAAVWSSLTLATHYDADEIDFSLTTGQDAAPFVVNTYGLVDPVVLAGGPLQQDPDQDAATDFCGAGFQCWPLEAVSGDLWWVIQTRDFQGADLDLFLLFDANEDGQFTYPGEVIDQDNSGDADEEVQAVLPEAGGYLVAVHAWGGSGTYSLKIYNVTTADQNASATMMNVPASITAGNTYDLKYAWDHPIDEGEEYLGLVTMGTNADPLALGFEPVRITGLQPAVTKMVDKDLAVVDDMVNYEVILNNFSEEEIPAQLVDAVPGNLAVDPNSVTGGASYASGEVSWNGTLPPAGNAVVIGPSDFPYGYLSLASLGVPPNTGCTGCDEAAINFTGDPVAYLGVEYTQICMVSNGYLVMGGCTSNDDIQFEPQDFPDVALPNNVIAPLWMDFDLDGGNGVGGGTWYAADLSDGVDNWRVFEWENAQRYGEPGTAFTFQVWLQVGEEAVTMTYGGLTGPLAPSAVGAENADASAGATAYYNDGAGSVIGTAPTVDDILDVSGGFSISSKTITYSATAIAAGNAVNTATMTSDMASDRAHAMVTVVEDQFVGSITQTGSTTPVVEGTYVDVDVMATNIGGAVADGMLIAPIDPDAEYVMGSAYGGATPLTATAAAQLAAEKGLSDLAARADGAAPDDVVAVAWMGTVATDEEVNFGFTVKVTVMSGELQHDVAVFDGATFINGIAGEPLTIVDNSTYPVSRSRRFNADRDTFINGAQPGSFYGSSQTMWTGFFGQMRPLVHTPLNGIPTDAYVDVAYLYLYIVEGRGFTTWSNSVINVEAHAITTEWMPDAANWWTPWDMPGGDYGPAVGANHIGSGKLGTWLRLDVTDAVSDRLRGGSDQGFIITNTDSNGVRYALATKEYFDSSKLGYIRVYFRTAN